MKLYADCLLVKGYHRSAIYDLGRNDFYLIPNSLHEMLSSCEGLSHHEIYSHYESGDKTVLDEYFEFLQDRELIFFIDRELFLSFPSIDLQWDFPARITNCIMDIKDHTVIDYTDAFTQLEQLGCHVIQLRIFCEKKPGFLTGILSVLDKMDIKSVEIVMKYHEELDIEQVNSLAAEFTRITGIFIYNCPVVNEYSDTDSFVSCICTNDINEKSCGRIKEFMGSPNITFFNESQHYNTCLNRKIAIDAEGNIKNCPSMAKSYGNIKDTKLTDVVADPGFQKLWSINKDQISVCKDCEFRHICLDCRAYLENPEDLYSKPLKCGYNPYTCEWEEWSTHPLKQNAIDFYEMRDILKKQITEV